MTTAPVVTLRARTDDDLDVLDEISADLASWEQRGPEAPAPLTGVRWESGRATRDTASSADAARFVVDVDGVTVGSAALTGHDWFARHSEAGLRRRGAVAPARVDPGWLRGPRAHGTPARALVAHPVTRVSA